MIVIMVVNKWFHGIYITEADCHILSSQPPVKLLQTYQAMQLTQQQLHWCGTPLLLKTAMALFVTTLFPFWRWRLVEYMCTLVLLFTWIFRGSTHTIHILVWLLQSPTGLDHSPKMSPSSLLKEVIRNYIRPAPYIYTKDCWNKQKKSQVAFLRHAFNCHYVVCLINVINIGNLTSDTSVCSNILFV